jgi:hypothetical protein
MSRMAAQRTHPSSVQSDRVQPLLQAYKQLQAVLNMVKKPTGEGRKAKEAGREPAHRRRQPQKAPGQEAAVRQQSGQVASDASRVCDAFAAVSHEHGTPGAIPTGDVGTVLQLLGIQLDVAQLFEAVKQLDSKGTGKVSLEDFMAWVQG